MFCYIHVNESEEDSPEIWHFPPQKPCIYSHTHTNKTQLKGNLTLTIVVLLTSWFIIIIVIIIITIIVVVVV